MSFDIKLVDGDLELGASGGLSLVFNEDKLTQDILKIIFTPTNSHELHKWYGSPLSSRVAGKVLPAEILESEIQNSILYALKNLKTLQDLQDRDNQFIAPKEAIIRIQNIGIMLDPVDPRQIIISIGILTKSGTVIEESFSISR